LFNEYSFLLNVIIEFIKILTPEIRNVLGSPGLFIKSLLLKQNGVLTSPETLTIVFTAGA
jgi:hypothetical protein